MKVINLDDERLKDRVLSVLREGGVVIFPTETVYGLIADAENILAVEKVAKIKGRNSKPISVLVSSFEMALKYVTFDKRFKKLWEKFVPGPITFVVKASPRYNMPYIVSPEKKVGVRAPDFQALLEIISSFGKGVTGTSANFSGKPAPSTKDEIDPNLVEEVDLVVVCDEPLIGKPSTVVELNDGVKILREGPIKLEEIESALQ